MESFESGFDYLRRTKPTSWDIGFLHSVYCAKYPSLESSNIINLIEGDLEKFKITRPQLILHVDRLKSTLDVSGYRYGACYINLFYY